MSQYTYVFCHGLNGWGEYDEQHAKKSYWGGDSGDVVAEWRDQGMEARAASVAPQGSAWDRACELYAQIAGVRTDYGAVHSAYYKHERYGRDFTGRPLISRWNDDTRLVLIGHSFGGATILQFLQLMHAGSEAERAATTPSPPTATPVPRRPFRSLTEVPSGFPPEATSPPAAWISALPAVWCPISLCITVMNPPPAPPKAPPAAKTAPPVFPTTTS